MDGGGLQFPAQDAGFNATLAGSSSGGGNDQQFTISEAVYYFLSLCLLALFCVCTRSRIPDERFLVAAAERRREWQQQEDRKDRMSDRDYRISLVLRGLVIKKIIEEKDGFLTLGDCTDDDEDGSMGDEGSAGGNISIDSMDEKTSTCAICLEPFRVGDVVGLSRTLFEESDSTMACNHAFHKDCIVAWLMNPTRDECPSCRTVIVEENEKDRERAGSKTDEESTSTQSYMQHIPEYQSNSVLVIMHGLVSRVRRASYSIIGQNIHAKVDDDIETGRLCTETPPSPFRRVFSLESMTQTRQRPSLRRRTSVGSMGEDTDAANDVSLPDVVDDPPPQSPPSDLRRVVSDFTGITKQTSTTASSTIASLGTTSRPLPLSFRPRTINRRVSQQYDHSECSLEDDIILRQVPAGKSIGKQARNDILLEHEIS